MLTTVVFPVTILFEVNVSIPRYVASPRCRA